MIHCPWCGRDYEPVGEGRCPQCGALPPIGLGSTAPPGAGGPPGEAGEGQGLPWERRAEVGLFRGLLATVRAVLFQPSRAFRAMSRTAPLSDPILFALVLGTLGLAFSGVIQALINYAQADSLAAQADVLPPFFREILLRQAQMNRNLPLSMALALIQAPFLAVLMPALAALLTHLCLMIFGAASAGLNATFRVVFYACGGTAVLCLVPICGWLAWLVWYLVAAAVGLRIAHRAGTGAAVAAVLLPLALGCCACVGLGGLVAMYLISSGVVAG